MRFDGWDWSSFGDGSARNVIIYGVDNSSSSHVDNSKNNFLTLGLGPTFEINGSFASPEKKISINFTKENKKFCLSLHYNADNSCLLVENKQLDLKSTRKMLTFWLDFL